MEVTWDGRHPEVGATPSVLDALSETIEAWLTQEEQAITKLARRRDEPAVSERLRVWQERLRAYEQFEAALAEGRAQLSRTSPTPAAGDRADAVEAPVHPRTVPPAVEHRLRLVS